MKKLLFATAIAASAAAFATDPFNAISFETDSLGASFENGASENNDFGTGPFFYFDGASNSSVVTNETPVSGKTRPKYYVDNPGSGNDQYLALDTEGGIFWRLFAPAKDTTTTDPETGISTTTWGFDPDATTTIGSGIYLDTMVQFTVTEDDPPAVAANDKLAIWLQAGEGTTNLMVKAGYYDGEGSLTKVTYSLTGKTVEPGQWYRLTVKAIDNALPTHGDETLDVYKIPAFAIYIDGNGQDALATATSPFDATFLNGLQGAEIISADQKAMLASGTIIPSLLSGEAGMDSTLQGVGFQGTGAIDDLVLTAEDPFPVASTIGFTLTWGEGISAVSYVLSTDLTTTNSLTSGTAAQIASGDGTATIELIPTFTSGYEFDKVTLGETDLNTLTFAIPSATAAATLYAKEIPPTYPDYIVDTTDAYITGKYNTWKNAYKADTASAWETAFLLNMDPDATVAEGTALLKIASITEVENGWQLEITSEATTLAAENGTTKVGNGYLRIKTASSLTVLDTDSATVTYIPVAVTDGKILVTVPTAAGQFMKAELTTTAPAATSAGE